MNQLSKYVLYYGKDQPPAEPVPLRAGPLSLVYENGDLRYVRLGGVEILRRVYVAVRDRNWGTVPATLHDEQIESGEDWFRIRYEVDHRVGEIDFGWRGLIEGTAEGSLTFHMAGEARRTFQRNRLGLCALLPATSAGAACSVEHLDGRQEPGHLPLHIAAEQPLPPFMDIQAVTVEGAPGQWAELRFSGEVFELEDQRNWTDASFKIFSTPLHLPTPVEVPAGTRIEQLLKLSLQPVPKATAARATPAAVSLRLSTQRTPLPALGLGGANHGRPLTAREVERLRALQLSHLRVDLNPGQTNVDQRLQQAAAEADQLGSGLEVALHISEAGGQALKALVRLIAELRPPVVRWLVYPALGAYDSPLAQAALRLARQSLSEKLPGVPIASGAGNDFIYLNRAPLPAEALDELCLALNPQTHAFDNASLVETLPMQAEVVARVRALIPGRPIVVSPLTLLPRLDVGMADPAPSLPNDQLPPNVDPRQMSLFGAAWTLGSLKYLAGAGVKSITYFETTGWHGVMETEAGSPLPNLFHSAPGEVFPLYHVLADAAEFRSGEVISLTSDDPLRADGLALSLNGKLRLILANYSSNPITLNLAIPNLAQARLRHLDERTAPEAMADPEAFRARPGETLTASSSGLILELQPYALATVDVTHA